MMIYSERNNKAGFAALIMFVSLLTGAPQAFSADSNDVNSNPVIGKSTSSIEFAESDIVKGFQIWNAGTGKLNYTLDINGADANYFKLDDANFGAEVNGQSVDINQTKDHEVRINHAQFLLLNRTLNAQIVIKDDNDNNDVNYITLTAKPADSNEPNDSNTPASSPEIGKSTSRINLIGNIVSKRFKIWNEGTGTLNYTVSVIEGADYFTVTPEDGNSKGSWDKRTHTVTVDYNEVVSAVGHGGTVKGEIEIKDDNDHSSYLVLSATETVATHVSRIAIEQGVNYGISPQTYDFRLSIETDGTVDEVDFNAPEGAECSILDYNESEDGSIRYWTYQEEFDDFNGLADYGDGRYTILVTYDDNDVAQTTVNFGIPNKPGAIAWPTQTPVLINPESGQETVSPVRLEWERCDNTAVNKIRVVLDNQDIDTRIERDYSKSTRKTSGIDLEPGHWTAELSFGCRYQDDKGNDDGIPYEVGKWSRSNSDFYIMKWFGNLDDGANHSLTLTDCNGKEVTFKLTGGGMGEIEDEDCGFTSIILTDTNDKSVFSITTKKGAKTAVGDIKTIGIATAGNIKSITGKNVNLEGNITIAGAAGAITLNDVNNSNITIGPATLKIKNCNVKLNEVKNLNLTSDTPIQTLQAKKWLTGSLDASWISTMTIKGNFGANLTLSGDNPKGMTLKIAKIAGAISGDWNVEDGNCGEWQFLKRHRQFSIVLASS